MSKILELAKQLEEEFKKHRWLECLVKTTVVLDADIDNPNDELITEICFAAYDMYEDVKSSMSIEDSDKDLEMFKEIIKDKDFKIMYRLFNV